MASSSPDLNSIRDASLRMLHAIDAGLAPLLWRGASTVMRGAVSQADFVTSIETTRADLGALKDRRWKSIESHVIAAGTGVPAGTYVNARFLSVDVRADEIQELLTYRFDDDEVWRITGYIAHPTRPRVAMRSYPRPAQDDHPGLVGRFPGLSFSSPSTISTINAPLTTRGIRSQT